MELMKVISWNKLKLGCLTEIRARIVRTSWEGLDSQGVSWLREIKAEFGRAGEEEGTDSPVAPKRRACTQGERVSTWYWIDGVE